MDSGASQPTPPPATATTVAGYSCVMSGGRGGRFGGPQLDLPASAMGFPHARGRPCCEARDSL